MGNGYFLLSSHQVMSEFLWPCGLQQARPPCSLSSPRVCPSSSPLHFSVTLICIFLNNKWIALLKNNWEPFPFYVYVGHFSWSVTIALWSLAIFIVESLASCDVSCKWFLKTRLSYDTTFSYDLLVYGDDPITFSLVLLIRWIVY